MLGREISQKVGQPVLVENKPGANGLIVTEQVAKSPPDGYTVLLTSNSHLVNQFLYKKLPYDPIGDFKSVALYKKVSPLVLVVAAGSPYRSIAEVTAAARARPGKVSYASGNTSSRVGAELYKQITRTDLLYVPYKGNPPALADVAGGQVDVMFSDSTSPQALIRANKLRALVVTGPDRLPDLPNVPTSTDAGMPELNIGSWGMLLLPRATPDAIAERLNQLVGEALASESAAKFFKESASEPFFGSRADLDRFMASELEKWGAVIRRAGIEAE